MQIGGLQKLSLIDYPGKIAAVIFTQGCNFRCHYCHNPELVNPDYFIEPIPLEEIFSFLKSRQDKLEAVVITGGEPLIQQGLEKFLKDVKKLGYLVKLDTNGSFPEKLRDVIEAKLVDYLAMDVKAPLRLKSEIRNPKSETNPKSKISKYEKVTGVKIDIKKIKKSIDIIEDSGLECEFRTTVLKSLLKREDILKIGGLLKPGSTYVLQKFVSSKILNPGFAGEGGYPDEELEEIREEIIKTHKLNCFIR